MQYGNALEGSPPRKQKGGRQFTTAMAMAPAPIHLLYTVPITITIRTFASIMPLLTYIKWKDHKLPLHFHKRIMTTVRLEKY